MSLIDNIKQKLDNFIINKTANAHAEQGKSTAKFIPDVIMASHETKGDGCVNGTIYQDFAKTIRMHYVYTATIPTTGLREMHDFTFSKYQLPQGMSMQDAYKVVSYLSEYIEKVKKIPEASCKSVNETDALLGEYFFTKLDRDNDTTPFIDLFTVGGNTKLFDKSRYASQYFEWFTEGVSTREVREIYRKLGLRVYVGEVFDNGRRAE